MEVGKANGNLPLYTLESRGVGVLNGVASGIGFGPFGGESRLVWRRFGGSLVHLPHRADDRTERQLTCPNSHSKLVSDPVFQISSLGFLPSPQCCSLENYSSEDRPVPVGSADTTYTGGGCTSEGGRSLLALRFLD